MVEHAVAALQAKRIEVALIAYGSTLRSSMRSATGPLAPVLSPIAQMYEAPFGMTLPAAYALAAQRHMHVYGTSSDQLARIAVAARAHAAQNPLAMYRDPLTVDEVLASPMIASPLHKLDCCVVSDGGGAIVLTNESRASSAAKAPVWVLGAAQGTRHHMISQMPDLTRSAAVETGRRAMSEAGITPDDVDLLMMYDSFTITVLIGLEDLGFCAKGDGGAFVEEGNIDPGGRLPMNVDGGGLSANHPGMRGIFLLTECVRQLRGEAGERQVAGAEVAVAHGVGGWLSSHATVVLGRD
jgi:acetyl-CoA acetyltransferase